MAINVDTFKQFVDAVSNKNGKGTVTPQQFNLYVNRALMEWTMKQYGNEDEYQFGRPIPRYAYEMTTNITDNLRHLKEVREFNVPSDGKVSIPDGSTVKDRFGKVCPKYMNFSSARTTYKVYEGTTDNDICGFTPKKPEDRPVKTYEKEVQLLRDDEIATYLDSTIVYPSVSYPKCSLFGSYLQIWPKKGLQQVTLTYLRQPNEVLWAFTTQNGRPVYDAANSVDIDAPDKAFNRIAMNVLSFLGISIREDQLFQYAELNKSKGV